MNRKKIIHLITSLEGGGTENFLCQLLTHSPEGFDPQVIYLKKDGVIGERLRRQHVRVRAAGTLPALYQMLRQEKPQVLHTCLYSAHIIGRLLGSLTHVPAIVTSQRSIDIWQKPWQTWLDRQTLPLSDAVIVNSRAAARVIEQRRGSKPRPEIFEIPNGVDTDSFKPKDRLTARQRYGLPSDAVVGGSLMRLHTEKGADFIPQLAKHLLPTYPKLHLVIGGVGPLQDQIKHQINGTGYRDRVHWIGWETDVPAFLSACDFFWSLSREESFPQTLVEASAMGVPWIAPDVGGVSELLHHGAVGLTSRRLDISTAAYQVGELLKTLPTLTEKARTAVPQIQMTYSLQKMVDRVYEVFGKVTSGK